MQPQLILCLARQSSTNITNCFELAGVSSLDVFVELASRSEGLGTLGTAVSLLLRMNAGDVLEKIRHHLPALSADLRAWKSISRRELMR